MKGSKFWGLPLLRSRVKSEDVKFCEGILGYFVGPFGVLLLNAVLVGYINVYFTDVLGISGAFLVIFPVVSSVFAVIVNLVMGTVIDRTHTPAGKARPYLFIAAPLLLISGIVLFTLPASVGSGVVQMFWIVVSYNLYLSIANTIYSMSNALMVPLSTRKDTQRSQLSVYNNISQSAAIGFISIVFPMVLGIIGTSKVMWTQVMCLVSAIACCAALLQYYFTRERITEENMGPAEAEEEKVPMGRQLKSMVTEKYWWIIIVFYILWQFSGTLKNSSMTYFANYIVGTYSDGITQSILAVIGALPLVIGFFVAQPLATRLGKQRFAILGMLVGAFGGAIMWTRPENMAVVCLGLLIKSIGMVPGMTIMMALFSDVLEHMEWKNGFRADGLSMSIYSACLTTLGGVCSGVLNAMLNASGYTAPDTAATVLSIQKIVNGSVVYNQPVSAEFSIELCYIFFEMVAWALIAVLLLGLNVEKNLPAEREEILARKKLASDGKN